MMKKKKTAKKKVVRRKAAKKVAKTKASKKAKAIGHVTHYYNRISVAIAKFHKTVPVGAVIAFKGATTDFQTTIASMQYDHRPITKAAKGKEVGIEVPQPVREGDEIYPVA